MLQAALHYLKLGLPIFPCKDKEPLIGSWRPYQKELPNVFEVKGWWKKWPDAQIAIVTGKLSGLVVIDIDSLDGRIAIKKFLPENFETPLAKTPHGWHLYCKWEPGVRNRTRVLEDVDTRGEGGYVIAPPSQNGKGEYKWVIPFSKGMLSEIPSEYLDFLKRGKQIAEPVSQKSLDFNQGHRDETLFHIADCLRKGGMPKNEIESVVRVLAGCCHPPFDPSQAAKKVWSTMQRGERQEMTLTDEIEKWVQGEVGTFSVTDVYRDLNFHSKAERATARKTLSRLGQRGMIERTGSKRGTWRVVSKDCEMIDWTTATTSQLDLYLPFGLHKIVKIMSGNIILLAGEQNAGKTVVMMNMLEMNMDLWRGRTNYFSSEMSGSEFRDRLEKWEGRTIDDFVGKFNVFKRIKDFHDVIDPDGLNLIDYLEVIKDFWQVGEFIDAIHQKLRHGVAVIAIQKDPRKVYGRGGSFTLEKPRLALSLAVKDDTHWAKITKAKSYVNPDDNPNGKIMRYFVENGVKIIEDSDWFRKGEE